MNPMQKQQWAYRTWLFSMAPAHPQKGRLTQIQRMILGYTSTRKDRKAKKVARTNRRLGRLHNGRK